VTNIHRQLREENSKLKHLGADLSLDRHILQEIVQKRSEALSQRRRQSAFALSEGFAFDLRARCCRRRGKTSN
jgi:hypothetical protein